MTTLAVFWRIFQDPKLIENWYLFDQNHPKSTAITSNHPQIHLQCLQTPLGVHRNHARDFFGIFHFFFPIFSSFSSFFLLFFWIFFYFSKCVFSVVQGSTPQILIFLTRYMISSPFPLSTCVKDENFWTIFCRKFCLAEAPEGRLKSENHQNHQKSSKTYPNYQGKS